MAGNWYVVRTEPRVEHLAAAELERDGLEVFFPRVHLPNTGSLPVTVPLFPGYLFLRCDPENEGWPSFSHLHRVFGWVRFQGEIPCMPNQEIDELMQRLEALSSQGGLWRKFRPGEPVQVDSGAIQILAQVVEESKSPQTPVKVLLNFMGRLVPAQVPWDHLKPISDTNEDRTRAPRRTRGKGRWIGGFRPQTAASR